MGTIKYFIITAIILRCLNIFAFVGSETINGITWTYTVSGDEASIGDGSQSAVPINTSGAITIPFRLGGYDVKRIGSCAFAYCSGLTNIVIPDWVTSIGEYAFYSCDGLSSIMIPNSVTNIGIGAFAVCDGLISINVDSNNNNYKSVNGRFLIKAGGMLVQGVNLVGEITIPDDVTSIGEGAFSGCNCLKCVTIPDSVTSIGDGAFNGCSALTDVTIPYNVRSIGSYAFYYCIGLTNIVIPGSVTNIGFDAFADCEGLLSIMVDDGNDNFLSANGLLLSKDGAVVLQGVNGDVMIPDSVTSIGDYAFEGRIGLTSIKIPNSVTNIGDSAFYCCIGLTNITIPSSVTTMAYSAFSYCSSLETIYVPRGFTGSTSFSGTSATVVRYSPTFTVAFDANGGEGGFSRVYSFGDDVVPPDLMPREGYAFAGWNPEFAAGLHVSNTTYVAQWTINRHTITFDANGGTGGTTKVQNYGSAIVVPTVSRTGYTFRGWDREVAATVPDEDIKYTAQWAINQYVVTFDANGGVGGTSGEQDYNSPIVAPSVSRVGYTFAGWAPEVDAVVPARDVTYVAQWTINKHTVTFDANGGTGGTTKVQNYGTAIIAPTVSRTGYTFKGWDKAVVATVPDEDVTYTAQWTINKYTVTFDANGGEGGTSGEQDYNSPIVAPSVSRVGYAFAGWSPEVGAVVPANDVTYVAQWMINKHTITFDANGGTGGRSITQDYGTAIVAPTVTRTGYNFTGWSPEVAATVPDEDVSYTAQWEAKQYTVTFDVNGGVLPAGSDSKSVTYDAAYGVLPTPALEFCSFDGWMLGGVGVMPSTRVATAADHALVAKWSRWGARISLSAISSGQTLRELYPDDYANLTTAVLAEGITELPVGFFYGCDNVESLTLPESLETLCYDDLPTKIRESLDYGADGFMVYQGWVLGYDNNGASALTLPQNTIGIGTRAFAEFWDLETVTIPDTVKHIGREAFFECTFLDDVAIPDSVVTVAHGAFENCSYMQTLSVGGGVRKVADRAFARCASLQAVAFADGLESVGECAFSNDWRMLSVSLPHSVTNIADGAFAACRRVKGVAVPANVMTLADMFPAAYTNIESVVVASDETDIMDDMFNGCSALTDFTWSGSETNVGERAFFGCESLTSVAMPDSVLRIGAAAFKGCSSLRDLTLSRSLVALPDFVFEECGSLDSFIVPASVMALGEGFVYESAVSAIYYLGNAPEYDANAYANVAANFVTYVVRGTRGWDGTPSSRVLPDVWIEHEITYWTPNRFDVTFDANGGYFGVSSVVQWAEQQITDMGYVLPNQNPVRPGYAFDGWWTEPTAGAQVKYSTQVTATKAHVLYAHWRLLGNLITATFNANGGTVVVPGSHNYVAGQTFGELPVPSRRGYAFCGWWTEASGGERITEGTSVPAADIELFAHWEPIRYFVAYDANGGTGTMTNQVHVYDEQKVLDGNLFSRTGYAFSGWARSVDGQVEYADRAEVVNLAEVSNEVVRLYAVWSGAGYNVRFDSNGGIGVMENQTIQISATQNLHTNAFVFSGREFLGWATVSAGAVVYRDGEAVCGLSSVNGTTVHLYAVWRVSDATWRVSFDGNGGSVAPTYWNVAMGESLDALPTPTRPGHAFMGWWTQRAGGTLVSPSFAAESNMTLYAHWRAYDDPLPPVGGDTGVASVMGDCADLRLGENVKTVDEYNALVEWADENGIDHQTVRTSLHVWASYVLGAEALLANEPEIEFEAVAVGAEGGGQGAARPTMTVSVSVRDGERAVAVDQEKVAAMFEATGDLGDWNGAAKLTPTVTTSGTDASGKMTFVVTPGDGTAAKAFLRIRK